MAVLQNMREKFGVLISVLIALSLLYFIAPMDDLMTLFGKPQNVGEIAGTGISYEDFNAEVENLTRINEIATGSSVMNEETQKQIRDAAWQTLLDRYMFFKNCDAAGIKVSDAEIRDLFKGENVTPIVAQNPYFADENGMFSADRVRDMENMAEEDASAKAYMDYLKNAVKTQQYYAKYMSLFVYSSIQNPEAVAAAVEEGNTTADIEYVAVPYPYVRDSSITVSSAEVKKFYKAHKDGFKQVASRDIEYVVYQIKPSDKDIADASAKMEKAYAEFAGAENVKNFILKNSDRTYSEYWYKNGELNTVSRELNAFVFSGKTGVSPVYQEGDSFLAGKVVASRQMPDSVFVKHILLQGEDQAKADSILKVVAARPATFAAVAAEFSADQGSNAEGKFGAIGWMTQSYMIPGFQSVLTAQAGKPFILDTQYGKHIVVVEKTTRPVAKKQVAILAKDIVASKETYNAEYNKASKFAGIAAGTYEGYLKAVDSLGVYSHTQNGVLESSESFGSVDQAKEVTRWVFDARKGKCSEILTVNNEYFFVVALKDVHKQGYTPVDEVASQIEYVLYTQKRNAAKTAEVAEKIEGLASMEEIAEAFGTSVATQNGLTFSPMGMAAVEPAVMGAALTGEIGAITGPVEGMSASYIVKVNAREKGTFYTEDDAKTYATQKSNYETQAVIAEMARTAQVEDNRARYY
ncbi:MAG: SurA N-terminal domain-containing protein [Bacteroidales bacterium]|nr:SurA N-terminal domain-containing protein [Bacteroidales bacterium]